MNTIINIAGMLAARDGLSHELDALARQREEIEARARDLKSQLAEIDATLRVLEKFAPKIKSETAATPSPETLAPAAPVGMATRDAMHTALRGRPGGGRLADLLPEAERLAGTPINPKTAGNILWYLKNDGLARREGKTWFPCERPAENQSAPPASADEARLV